MNSMAKPDGSASITLIKQFDSISKAPTIFYLEKNKLRIRLFAFMV